jgi:ABC-type dipeptide/oligopeptide/nickel transport system ATPase component
MAIKLSAKNFQSWEEFELPIEDLTVVVGESNLGKSALFRSLMGIVRNQLNAGQIRVGSDLMEVTLEIDGHTIVASRKKGAKGSVVYVVDGGEPYAKLGGAIPQEVLDLNMGDIHIGDIVLDPIFATQFGGQFIIEEKPGPLNAILGAFSSTERLEGGKKVGNKRIGEKNTQATMLAKETRVTEERVAALDLLTGRAEVIQNVIDRIEPKVRTQEKILAGISLLIAHKQRLAVIESTLSRLAIPDTRPITKAITLATNYAVAAEARRRESHIKSVLQRFIVPDAEPVSQGIALTTSYAQAAIAKGRHIRTTDILKRLTVPDASLALDLQRKVVNLTQLADASNRLVANSAALDSIELIVSTWTGIVALHKRNKTLSEAETALDASVNSTTKVKIAAIDAITAQISAHIIQVEKHRAGIRQYEALARGREAHLQAQLKLSDLEAEYAAAQAAVATLEAELRTVEHKKTHSKGVLCSKCGDPVSVNPAA